MSVLIPREILQVLPQLPPLPPVGQRVVARPRCKCGAFFDGSATVAASEGSLRTKFCADCLKSDYARLVCNRCRKIIFLVEPKHDPKTGFQFQRRKFYHMSFCGACRNDADGNFSQILEVAQHLRANARR